MSRRIAAFFGMLLCSSLLASSAWAQCGDVNVDGVVNSLDPIDLSDTDNNGMLQAADAFSVATQVSTGQTTAYSLRCARRPEGTQP